MRKIYLLFFLALMALQFNARSERINVPGLEVPKLIITEVRPDDQSSAYVEITNIGDTAINLEPFTLHSVHYNTRCIEYSDSVIDFNRMNAAVDNTIGKIFLKGILEPGESFVVANVWDAKDSRGRDIPRHNTAIAELGDQFGHRQETFNDNGWINKPEWQCFGHDSFRLWKPGRHEEWIRAEITAGYLLHWVYAVDSVTLDSTYIDNFNHAYYPDETTNGMKGWRNDPIAGVENAMGTSIMVRKASVTKGNLNWTQSRGTSPETSEWLVLPKNTSQQMAFTTAGTHGGVHNLEYEAKDPSNVIIDDGASTISVPWELVRGDSLARHLNLGDGMGWKYDLVGSFEDTASYIARTGDKFTLYAVGNEVQMKEFELQVREAEADLALVFPRRRLIIDEVEVVDEETGVIDTMINRYWSTGFVYALSEGPEIDSIINLSFATRVDSLLKYLDKPEKASWEIVFVDGEDRVDLMFGDKLKVTSEDGSNIKEYFLAVNDHAASNNTLLSTVTWPDIDKSIPTYIRWNKGDTLPEFTPLKTAYTIELAPNARQIPALQFKPQNLRAKLKITNALDINGNLDQRTTTVEVISESDTLSNTYYFTFEKQGTPVQPNIAEPFISELIWNAQTQGNAVEFFNPGTEELDLSQYMYVRGTPGQTWQEAVESVLIPGSQATFAHPNDGIKIYKSHYSPSKRWRNDGSLAEWRAEPTEENPFAGAGFLIPDNQTDPYVAPGDVWVGGVGTHNTRATQVKIRAESDFIWKGATVDGTVFAWDSTKILHRETPVWGAPVTTWLLKMVGEKGDSIRDGLKDVRDASAYQLIDRFEIIGNDTVAGRKVGGNMSLVRKPEVSKGNLDQIGGGLSTPESSEWIVTWINDPGVGQNGLVANIGVHTMNPITNYLSTVTSIILQVTPGYVGNQSITGNIADYTVESISAVLDAADSSQVWVFKRDGTALADDAALADGDKLEVTSGDGKNTTVYELINNPLDDDTSLSAKAGGIELAVDGTKVTGVTVGMTLKEALADLEIAPKSILNVLDASGALQPLTMHNLDTLVYDVLVSEDIMLEVVAENKDKQVYYFDFGLASNEAVLLSNIIPIDQVNKRIMEIPAGSSAPSMLAILFANEGASVRILDKAGFERTMGFINIDDVVEVTAPDGVTKVIYGFDEGMFPVSVDPELQTAGEFTIYPNPVSSVLNVQGINLSTVEVYSITGSMMIYDTNPSYSNKIDVRSLPRGIYVLKITDDKGRVEVDKFLKR